MQVNGQQIEKGELARLIESIKPAIAQVEHLSTFEITTALGFLHFANQKANAAVIEVGLGGRLDATNVVDPQISVITSLSMDHVGVLGDTLPKIAYEKAGIIKPSRPVVLAVQRDDARQVIEQVAAERGSPLIEIGKEYHYATLSHSLKGQTFQVWKTGEHPVSLATPLLGLHQVENAATAFAALRVANEQGMRVTDEDIRKGFANVFWPGRLEVLRAEPAPAVIVDSAHNRDSAHRLNQALDDYLPGRPVVLIFGASEDKDIDGMFAELMPRVSKLIATQSTHPRAMDANLLAEMARQHGKPADVVIPVEDALPAAIHAAEVLDPREPGVVLAAGSLFIAAAIRDTWKKLCSSPQGPSASL
jgi:dihydrofolate synthase/folylpolyglutamate synthase